MPSEPGGVLSSAGPGAEVFQSPEVQACQGGGSKHDARFAANAAGAVGAGGGHAVRRDVSGNPGASYREAAIRFAVYVLAIFRVFPIVSGVPR